MSGMCTKPVISPKVALTFKQVIHQMRAYIFLYLHTEVRKGYNVNSRKYEF